MRRAVLILATVGIVLIIVPWGDFQDHTHWAKVGWIPFVSPPIRIRDIVLNVLLFLPFGAAVTANVGGARAIVTAAIAGSILSFVGEAAQLYTHTRFPSATDLLMNTAGAALGAFLVWRRNARKQ